jgi:hypothetical protein
MARSVGGAAAQATAKTAFAGAGALSQATGAMEAVSELGGTGRNQAGAFFSSLGSSAKETMLTGGGNLARSLLSGESGRGGGGGGGLISRYDNLQGHLKASNDQGHRQTLGEYTASRHREGQNRGLDYMIKHGSAQVTGAQSNQEKKPQTEIQNANTKQTNKTKT